jgi:hypothetical protein
MDPRRALLLAHASRAAYVRRETSPNQPPSWWPEATLSWVENSHTSVLIAQTESDIVLAFRGSDDLTDWKTNLSIGRRRLSGASGKWHGGFLDALDQVFPRLLAYLHSFPNARVWLTGHSQGAALAGIFAARLELLGWGYRVAGIETFGGPRFTSLAGARWMDRVFHGRFIRFVNYGDRVAWVPPTVLGYYHAGTLAYFDPAGRLHFGSNAVVRSFCGLLKHRLRRSLLGDHSRNTYVRLLAGIQ